MQAQSPAQLAICSAHVHTAWQDPFTSTCFGGHVHISPSAHGTHNPVKSLISPGSHWQALLSGKVAPDLHGTQSLPMAIWPTGQSSQTPAGECCRFGHREQVAAFMFNVQSGGNSSAPLSAQKTGSVES